MRMLIKPRFLGLLGILAVAACDDIGTDLGFEDLTAEQQLELAVLADEASFDVAVTMTSVSNDVAVAHGQTVALQARTLNAEARAAFHEARREMLAGNHRRALEVSDIARRLVARSLIATGGVPAVEDLIERLEDLLLTLDNDVFDNPEALRAELEAIIAEAHALLEAGDSVGAAARAILGEQRARFRRGQHDRRGDVDPDRARLEVSFAGVAVSLAERLIADQVVPIDVAQPDASGRRNRWLANARHMLEHAQQALSNGHFARALHFAQHAQWSALKAVILPGGITEDELDAMVVLATELHEQASTALGANPDIEPSELELRILGRAGDLLEIGIRKLEAGHRRGVAALWRSAVMSSWLIR
ncbi:MAG: HEPN domain-containing protein [Gemmatimonadetes bacterium]|nr:HEPN domain-containing protein [Gemmatimonadota bacterium]MDA1103121.1 HEPN domain-containing protein [Gemmatimonadota bacterium]